MAQSSRTARPPVVVVVGHIDHGKSTLLDSIRKTNVVAGEAGGITQHISAYEVTHTNEDGTKKKITFLDTPGHEAFSAQRTRGTNVADIAILVVAADDGVNAQTREAIATITARSIPYVIAINKIDKEQAQTEKTINDLAEAGVYLEGHGGNVPFARVSAKTGAGIPELMELILLVAEISELSANRDKPAEGIVIEAHRDPKKGISGTLVIRDGTLTKGGCVLAGSSIAPVRIMEDFRGEPLDTALPSQPVRIVGWNTVPHVGSAFSTHMNKKSAEACMPTGISAPVAAEQNKDEETVFVPILLKADTAGSIEAVEHELQKLSFEKLCVKIIDRDVGEIGENDLKLLGGDESGIILGFRVGVESGVRELAKRSGITIETFDIIYALSEWLAEELERRRPRQTVHEVSGKAKILKTFSQTKKVQIVGGAVRQGSISTGDVVTIFRRTEPIGEGRIKEIQQERVVVEQVQSGAEFGASIETSVTIAVGDTIEATQTITR